jgi:hypothetical protein
MNRLVINLFLIGAFCIGFYIAFFVFNLPLMWSLYGGAGLGMLGLLLVLMIMNNS